MIDCGLTRFYELLNAGAFKTKKVGGMRLVEGASINAFGTERSCSSISRQNRASAAVALVDIRFAREPRSIDFERIKHAALVRLPDLLTRWLPGGRVEGAEYVVRNPKRHDRKPGSFKINLAT